MLHTDMICYNASFRHVLFHCITNYIINNKGKAALKANVFPITAVYTQSLYLCETEASLLCEASVCSLGAGQNDCSAVGEITRATDIGALSAKTTEVSQTARLQLHCCSLRVVQPPAAIKDFGVTVQVCTCYASIMVTL